VDEAYEETRKAYETGESPPYLRTGISELDEHLNAGPGDLVVVAARPAMGKAQPVDCNVLTPSGFVKIGSLRVGDKVIGSNGKPTTVLGVYPQGVKKVYRVRMSDGGETRCCDEHLWLTQTRNDRRFNRGYLVRSLREVADTIRIEHGNRFNHNIPIVASVEFGGAGQLPIHPWLLGAFIGDGSTSSGNVKFSKPEEDVYTRFSSLLPDGDVLSIRDGGLDCTVRNSVRRNGVCPKMRSMLTELGLHGKGSHERSIPRQYLLAGVEDRIQLLRGLCDTDGYVTSGQAVEYTTTSPALARDFMFLVRSLGGLASMAVKKTSYTYKGERLRGRDAYRFVVSFPNGLVPVSSAKHLRKWSESPKPYRLRQVDTVSPDGEAECVCIAVDAPDHLYVTDDFIITHNTVYADQWAGHVAKNYGSVGFFSLEMPKRQIGQRNLARQSGVGLKAITDGRNLLHHEIEELVRARNELTDLSFFVDDLPSLSPATLKMKVRALRRKMENEGRPALVMVVIDYLQLADVDDSGSDNRTVAIGRFTRMCKVLARDENIVVVLVSQLNRSLESRTNKRPIPSDLRESGSIEQDADSILFIYRDEVYDPASADKGMAEIIIAKQRQGSLATAKVPFNGSVSRFGSATQTGATRMVGNG
jgi:replicative DNA helicase